MSGLALVAAGYPLAAPLFSRRLPHLYYDCVDYWALSTLPPPHPPQYSRPWGLVLLSTQSFTQLLGLATGAKGFVQASPLACRDSDACGMTRPTIRRTKLTVREVYIVLLCRNVELGTLADSNKTPHGIYSWIPQW